MSDVSRTGIVSILNSLTSKAQSTHREGSNIGTEPQLLDCVSKPQMIDACLLCFWLERQDRAPPITRLGNTMKLNMSGERFSAKNIIDLQLAGEEKLSQHQ